MGDAVMIRIKCESEFILPLMSSPASKIELGRTQAVPRRPEKNIKYSRS